MENTLDKIFNPSWPGFLINDYFTEEEKKERLISRQEFERRTYQEITKELEQDLINVGIPVSYSTKILIGELAFNLILYSRVKFYLLNRDILKEGYVWKVFGYSGNRLSNRKRIDYDQLYSKEYIHPLFGDYLIKLEKTINNQLRLLGLLPEQQIERQKIKLIQRLKKKLYEIGDQNKSVEVSAVFEKQI